MVVFGTQFEPHDMTGNSKKSWLPSRPLIKNMSALFDQRNDANWGLFLVEAGGVGNAGVQVNANR